MTPQDPAGPIRINPGLSVPRSEVSFQASRSSGPGGQHVNKVSTAVILSFDVQRSPSLSGEQRDRLLTRLRNRIGADGVLQVRCQRHRSQHRNKEEAVDRFSRLLEQALRRPRVRRPTRTPRSAKERRLQSKRRRGRTKQARSNVSPADDP